MKENPQIVRIIEASEASGGCLDACKIFVAKVGKLRQKLPEAKSVILVALFEIGCVHDLIITSKTLYVKYKVELFEIFGEKARRLRENSVWLKGGKPSFFRYNLGGAANSDLLIYA